MKKLIAVLTLACFLAACVPAFAEVSDGSPLTMYGITLNLEAGLTYTVTGSTIEDFDIEVYPLPGNDTSYINVSWIGMGGDIEAVINAQRQYVEEQYRSMFESYGLTPDLLSISEVRHAALDSRDILFFDLDVILNGADGARYEVHQRLFYCPDTGHVLSIITEDAETMDRLVLWLDGAVSF